MTKNQIKVWIETILLSAATRDNFKVLNVRHLQQILAKNKINKKEVCEGLKTENTPYAASEGARQKAIGWVQETL